MSLEVHEFLDQVSIGGYELRYCRVVTGFVEGGTLGFVVCSLLVFNWKI